MICVYKGTTHTYREFILLGGLSGRPFERDGLRLWTSSLAGAVATLPVRRLFLSGQSRHIYYILNKTVTSWRGVKFFAWFGRSSENFMANKCVMVDWSKCRSASSIRRAPLVHNYLMNTKDHIERAQEKQESNPTVLLRKQVTFASVRTLCWHLSGHTAGSYKS